MPIDFFSLPSELRNTVYELALLQDEPIDPWDKYYRLRKLTPGLFRANKAVYHESSSLFYSRNQFDFTTRTSEEVTSFLGQIGRTNAQHIQHIYLDFPDFVHLDPGDVTIDDDDIRILARFRLDCGNLRTLTTALFSTNVMELRLDALDRPVLTDKVLKLVDDLFKAISSLREIVVEVYDGPSDHVRSVMEKHGWTIKTIKVVEELGSERRFDDGEDF